MATFQEYHGISLASNSWIENLFVEQLTNDPVPVGPGRVWFNTTDKKFKQSTLDATGGVIVRVFATEEDLLASVASLSSDISNLRTDLTAETSAREAADTALSNRIDALGNAFNYVGALTGGADVANAFDLSSLPADGKNSGDYYKVTTAGYFKVGAGAEFFANVGDGLVWNTFGGVDKIDNTDSNVQGTTDYIAVTGSADTGFVVDIDTTFKARVTSLEGGVAAEEAARQATDAALAAEVSRATGVEGSLASLTTDAKSNLVAAINEVQSEIISETSARIAAVDAEASARAAADAQLTSDLAAETSARIAADTAETSARQAADAVLQAAIDAEQTARVAGDAALTASLAAETTARQAADAQLTSDLAAEVTRATAAEAALQAAINTEASARAAADGDLSTLTTTAKTDLVSAINEVKSLAGDGVASLVTQLNSYRYTFTSSVAATSFTITHGLGSTLVDVCVWIDRGDGVWRNDMAAVSILDGTSVKVDLTAARNVRVTVEKMEAFA